MKNCSRSCTTLLIAVSGIVNLPSPSPASSLFSRPAREVPAESAVVSVGSSAEDPYHDVVVNTTDLPPDSLVFGAGVNGHAGGVGEFQIRWSHISVDDLLYSTHGSVTIQEVPAGTEMYAPGVNANAGLVPSNR
ncbi:MAG: hypothetical protein FJ271_31870 [Planctomycetes bacterium]|nr:hypothetical protein [Planctomycetota bacterium]